MMVFRTVLILSPNSRRLLENFFPGQRFSIYTHLYSFSMSGEVTTGDFL